MPENNNFISDLLNIEVNTILKKQMSGQKIPSVPFALHDVIRAYGKELEYYGADLSPFFLNEQLAQQEVQKSSVANSSNTETQPPNLNSVFPPALLQKRRNGGRFDFREVKNGWISFEIIRLVAKYMYKRLSEFPDAKENILVRIRRNSDQLKYIVRTMQLNPPPINARCFPYFWRKKASVVAWTEVIDKTLHELQNDALRNKQLPLKTLHVQDLTRIRKIWEIGTEEIIAQTSISVDGDVVTRLAESMDNTEFKSKQELLLGAHRQSVEISLRQWHGLVQVAVDLLKIVGTAVTGVKGGK